MNCNFFQIGNCKLYNYDCLDIISKIDNYDTVITDPPYGMDFRSNHRKIKYNNIKNDQNCFLLNWATNLKAKHSKYIFCRWDNLYDVKKPNSLITWVKNNWSMGDLKHEHARQTEVCLFYKEENHFFPKKRPTDVIFSNRTDNKYHPTEKPLHLMLSILEWTKGTVFDPFMGSGTTGVACAKLGRKFIGIELDKNYFDIACKRITDAYNQPDFFMKEYKNLITEQVEMDLL